MVVLLPFPPFRRCATRSLLYVYKQNANFLTQLFPVSREEIKAVHPLSFTDKGRRVFSRVFFPRTKDQAGKRGTGVGRGGGVRSANRGTVVGVKVGEWRYW